MTRRALILALLRRTGGMAMVEFALLLPVFLFLILAILQFGQVLWTQAAMEHAVVMAARCASVDTATCSTANSGAAIATFAAQQAYGLSLPAGTFTWNATTSCVVGQYNFVLSGFLTIAGLLPASMSKIALSAQSCYPVPGS
jgi:Flp pilus assembly protein TadG